MFVNETAQLTGQFVKLYKELSKKKICFDFPKKL